MGDKYWYQHGVLHRNGDMPAFDSDRRKEWYHYGKLHRDGNQPAIIFDDGLVEYWVGGERGWPSAVKTKEMIGGRMCDYL